MTDLHTENKDVVLSGITKRFGDTTVFVDFSLTVKGRGVTALMGASGRGKTTLASIILGLEGIDGGEIVNPHTEISVAFQDPRLLPWMTAEDNVAFVLTGIPRKEKRRLAREILTRLGLGDALRKYPAELSGGMRRRVSLARAFLAPHTLLILDEPFAGLDPDNRETVLEMIRAEAEHAPVILITHAPEDAEALNATVVRL